ncbi:hypothetical protein [Paenibacillus anseongense]|uniref:hypothetical protein n=1 Tax=Paenibacillus anseongense TaxID=2682845 RepID=UPI002DBF1CBA|nr:hypothetical protein [Paenibacillus anseongense]MEC0271453.1 hypothetical protein [Paenibacillus anseongense]
MNISELWKLYEADKRIQGFIINTLKAYALQLRMLVNEIGDIHIFSCNSTAVIGILSETI